MLRIVAGWNESGIYQLLPAGLTRVVASVWVYVLKGKVAFRTNGGVTGPVSWRATTNEWELLRVCTDRPCPLICSWCITHPAGGEFYIDRAEMKSVP
jgi:hypothetical protein